nr:hypothetical protein [Methylobacterium sp. ZNC0032]
MAARGVIKPGSLTARVLDAIAGSQSPIGRGALLAMLTGHDRSWLGRTLDRLITLGHVRECRAGYELASAPRPLVPGEREPERLSPGQRAGVQAVICRAHRYRQAGAPFMAVSLLERAAARRLPTHVQQDLSALAGLFAEHCGTYRDVEPARAAA